MNQCGGCGYRFASSREVFGGAGEAWCCVCWHEEIELAVLRRPLLHEREHCAEYIECCELEIAEFEASGRILPGDIRGTQYRLAAEVAADTARERLADIDEELACMTVQYQRQWSVIGMAA